MTKPKTKNQTPSRKHRIKPARYTSFRLEKRIRVTHAKLPSSWTLYKQTMRIIRQNKRFFLGLTVVYGLLSYVFVHSLSAGVDVTGLKELLGAVDAGGSNLVNSAAVFGILVSSAAVATETATLYQLIITLLTTLALIWGLRQIFDKPKAVSIREVFYNGMYPLVPFLLVLAVVGLELIPLSIAGALYNTTIVAGLAVTAAEQIFWLVLCVLLILLTLHLITASIMALFIVALPEMTPVEALRSANRLVLHRRWEVLRKLIVLPLGLFVVIGTMVILVIALTPGLAEILFFVANIAAWPLIVSYLYVLYRNML